MNCILIIGGTSGIGEAFARRFDAIGKKVIVAGRRAERLDVLAKELQGLETVQVRTTLHASRCRPRVRCIII